MVAILGAAPRRVAIDVAAAAVRLLRQLHLGPVRRRWWSRGSGPGRGRAGARGARPGTASGAGSAAPSQKRPQRRLRRIAAPPARPADLTPATYSARPPPYTPAKKD